MLLSSVSVLVVEQLSSQFPEGLTNYTVLISNFGHNKNCQKINRLKPNDPYMGRTAQLTTKRCILYIYSTNIGTEYFKHALYSPFYFSSNAVCFIMLTCLIPVLFTFYIQDVLKLKKNNFGAKGLSEWEPCSSRPVRRPRLRWLEQVEEDL